MRWQFKGRPPASVLIVFALFLANSVLLTGAGYFIPHSSPTQPDAAHSYAIRFKGGAVYFVQPWLGKYFSYGLWAGFVLFALCALIMWFHRDELERIS